MTTILEDRYVNSFYLSLLNGNFVEEDANIAARLAEAARTISDPEIEHLLATPDWRSRLCAAWFIGLSRRAQFVPRVGELLFSNANTYADQGYCMALTLIGTQECVRHLHLYLESGREDLQSWVVGALSEFKDAPPVRVLDHSEDLDTGVEAFRRIVGFLREHQIIAADLPGATGRCVFSSSHIEAICRDIYSETRVQYDSVKPDLGSAALGFRILYGPPAIAAPYVFLGFQPGGTKDESDEGQHDGWPDRSWYASSKAPLARQLRYIFAIDTVRHSGLNMIFFRARNLAAWDSIPPKLKTELERFSLERVERLIAALQPQHLIVIGLRTFRQLTQGDGVTVLRGKRGNRLVVQGAFGGRLTSGIVHLSGARVSGEDRELLKGFFNPAAPPQCEGPVTERELISPQKLGNQFSSG